MKPFKYLVIITILLVFSGCALSFKKEAPKRQVPEVMLGQDCGFDKLKCCKTEPNCSFGQQCCVDPNDSTRNYCAEDCSCGDNEEFCCAGNKCNGDTTCYRGICLSCGGKDQSCCQEGVQCQKGLACQNGDCKECGVKDGPCCPGEEKCAVKEGQRAECLDDVCRFCGFDGNLACLEGDKCIKGQIFAGKTCERCGGSNQPCCNVASSTGYECDSAKGLKCDLGFCSTTVK
jgi:hypothetical protein